MPSTFPPRIEARGRKPPVTAPTPWPRATSCGTNRRPKTPAPPATNTHTTITS
jgi:hypothetical protein